MSSITDVHRLFPSLPLYAGVLITAADSLIVLLFFGSNNGRRGMLFFEIVIVSLVLAVFASFMVLLHLVKPDWKDVFLGLVPSNVRDLVLGCRAERNRLWCSLGLYMSESAS